MSEDPPITHAPQHAIDYWILEFHRNLQLEKYFWPVNIHCTFLGYNTSIFFRELPVPCSMCLEEVLVSTPFSTFCKGGHVIQARPIRLWLLMTEMRIEEAIKVRAFKRHPTTSIGHHWWKPANWTRKLSWFPSSFKPAPWSFLQLCELLIRYNRFLSFFLLFKFAKVNFCCLHPKHLDKEFIWFHPSLHEEPEGQNGSCLKSPSRREQIYASTQVPSASAQALLPHQTAVSGCWTQELRPSGRDAGLHSFRNLSSPFSGAESKEGSSVSLLDSIIFLLPLGLRYWAPTRKLAL